ncbi:serine hydrolase [Streptomyces pluripotens]|uniref:Serine hydrolase n=1 Tax=Streptomyces pluripotens TaxID=1355015 RepID=A0A221NWH0_9ACTN|nr:MULTISPECIES: serine hydrolase domain-containing protein [Streptomyces]ARP70052.1 serine hydrolase [Streptomyces pluripotens]ASN24311.1 serine hydrolase [Streptomyces pluripotens]KIE25339.1 beta-lactamase [Streptomyces sp. MUSC 125]MCH0559920.1 beta-lactamase family protein [Streptomyces sp. MUM 16J]
MSLQSLALIENWPVPTAAAGVVRADGTVLGARGPVGHRFPLASVTKPLTAYAALVAYEEGAIELDEPAGPPGSTVRHLLAHTSGLAFDEHRVMAPAGERRLYSNAGFEQLGDHIARATEIPFAEYLRQAVLDPLGMTSTTLVGSPAKDGVSSVEDLLRFAAEVQAPRLLDPRTVADAMTVQYPGTKGVLPGYGHQNPNDWGLGFEIRDSKSPHWTGSSSSPRTFGHFGQSGTFLWIDPDAEVAGVALTDRAFGPWAIEAWPPFTDAVLRESRAGR